MTYSYPAIIHNDNDGLWLEFYDLIGCQTFADNMEELLKNAKEALLCFLEEEMEYSGKLPAPTDMKNITVNAADTLIVISIELPTNNIIAEENKK